MMRSNGTSLSFDRSSDSITRKQGRRKRSLSDTQTQCNNLKKLYSQEKCSMPVTVSIQNKVSRSRTEQSFSYRSTRNTVNKVSSNNLHTAKDNFVSSPNKVSNSSGSEAFGVQECSYGEHSFSSNSTAQDTDTVDAVIAEEEIDEIVNGLDKDLQSLLDLRSIRPRKRQLNAKKVKRILKSQSEEEEICNTDTREYCKTSSLDSEPDLSSSTVVKSGYGSNDSNNDEVSHIASRTRSRLSLVTTPSKRFLPSVVSPDITDSDYSDKVWVEFQNSLNNPLDEKSTSEEEGDDDPDYIDTLCVDDSLDELDSKSDDETQPTIYILDDDAEAASNKLHDSKDEKANQESEVGELGQTDDIASVPLFMIVEDVISHMHLNKSESWFSPSERLQLEHQMRMHVQLLCQSFLLSYGLVQFANITSNSLKHLEQLKILNKHSQQTLLGNISSFCACNLDEALNIVKNVKGNYRFINRIQHGENSASDISYDVMGIIAHSKVFIYPSLLPEVCYHYPMKKVNCVETSFFSSEDTLIAMGLEDFGETVEVFQYIQSLLLPTKTVTQIKYRVENVKETEHSDSPLKSYFMTKEWPCVPRYTMPFNPLCIIPPSSMPIHVLPPWMNEKVSYPRLLVDPLMLKQKRKCLLTLPKTECKKEGIRTIFIHPAPACLEQVATAETSARKDNSGSSPKSTLPIAPTSVRSVQVKPNPAQEESKFVHRTLPIAPTSVRSVQVEPNPAQEVLKFEHRSGISAQSNVTYKRLVIQRPVFICSIAKAPLKEDKTVKYQKVASPSVPNSNGNAYSTPKPAQRVSKPVNKNIWRQKCGVTRRDVVYRHRPFTTARILPKKDKSKSSQKPAAATRRVIGSKPKFTISWSKQPSDNQTSIKNTESSIKCSEKSKESPKQVAPSEKDMPNVTLLNIKTEPYDPGYEVSDNKNVKIPLNSICLKREALQSDIETANAVHSKNNLKRLCSNVPYIKNEPPEDSKLCITTDSSAEWTKEEDYAVIDSCERYGLNMDAIMIAAATISTKTVTQVKDRFFELMKLNDKKNLDFDR